MESNTHLLNEEKSTWNRILSFIGICQPISDPGGQIYPEDI